ncbi:MAG: multiheme c-type cytochrome [Candidatus Anammoxibacter sp.]
MFCSFVIKKRFFLLSFFVLVAVSWLCVTAVNAREMDWKLGKLAQGEGKYGKYWLPSEMFRWWDPNHFFECDNGIEGTFEGEQCIKCHTVVTPGIVNDWKKSAHSEKSVTCNKCHGNDHQKLRMPTTETCKPCHEKEVAQHVSQLEAGHPSHARAFHPDIVEVAWQISKPQTEVNGCAQCHAIENRCDSCHTRHRFNPGEARHAEACGICHIGPGARGFECYESSMHGVIAKIEKDSWDWNKPLRDANYRTPTCAYCHMYDGNHNVIKNTVFGHAGITEVDRGSKKYKEKRDAWIRICSDCHSSRFAAAYLRDADDAVRISHKKVREAKKVIEDLYNEELLEPMPKDLAPFLDQGHKWALGSRMHNVPVIEREFFDLVVFYTTTVFKGVFHMSPEYSTVKNGAFAQDASVAKIKSEASKLRRLAALEEKAGIKFVPEDFWKKGEYLDTLVVIDGNE